MSSASLNRAEDRLVAMIDARRRPKRNSRCPDTAIFDAAFHNLRKTRGADYAKTRAAHFAHWSPERPANDQAKAEAERLFAGKGRGA